MKKTCTQCDVEQREMDFYRSSAGKFMSVCKACHRANARAYRASHAEHYREYDRNRANLPHRIAKREAYVKTPQGRDRSSAAKKRYIERNPVKRNAHNVVNAAVRDGKIVRMPCEVCGEKQAQAHHDDYGKPLDVRWLCTTHHSEWHKHNTPLCPDQEQAA